MSRKVCTRLPTKCLPASKAVSALSAERPGDEKSGNCVARRGRAESWRWVEKRNSRRGGRGVCSLDGSPYLPLRESVCVCMLMMATVEGFGKGGGIV